MLVDVAKRAGQVGSIGSQVKSDQSDYGSIGSGPKILTRFAMSRLKVKQGLVGSVTFLWQ